MKTAVSRIKRVDFEAFLKNRPEAVYNKLGTLKFNHTNPNKSFCVVVSSKHEKRAVRRNKLRRRLRSIFEQSPIQTTAILYASKQSYTMEYEEIKKLFIELLEKIQKATK